MPELNPCPFCGEKARIDRYENFYRVLCTDCPASTEWLYSEQEAIEVWNTRAERTCRKVPGRMRYGERKPKCSECGYSLGDPRWFYCPKCGGKITNDRSDT